MSSATSVGKKAQCHPRSRVKSAAMIMSIMVSAGENPPPAKSGNTRICVKSATRAASQAQRFSADLSDLTTSSNNIDKLTTIIARTDVKHRLLVFAIDYDSVTT